MFFTMIALLEPGDEVVYPNPGFPIYESMIQFLGATPVPIPLIEERGFSFDLDRSEARLSDRTKMVILVSPRQSHRRPGPGATTSSRMADLLRHRDVMVLSDEIYSRIIYDGEPCPSPASTGCSTRPSSWMDSRRPIR